MKRARPYLETEPSLPELLRQAMEGFLPAAPALDVLFNRMERLA